MAGETPFAPLIPPMNLGPASTPQGSISQSQVEPQNYVQAPIAPIAQPSAQPLNSLAAMTTPTAQSVDSQTSFSQNPVDIAFQGKAIPQVPKFKQLDDGEALDSALKTPIAHKIIAGIMAANGQPQWMTSIIDRERKTKLHKVINPHLMEVDRLRLTGDLDKAREKLMKISAGIGDQSPEAQATIKGQMDHINKSEMNRITYGQYIDRMEIAMKDNLSYTDYDRKRLELMKANYKNKSAISDVLIDMDLKAFESENRYENGVNVNTSKFTRKSTYETTPLAIQLKDFPPDVIQQFVRDIGIPPSEIVNAMQGKTVFKDGKDITSQVKQWVSDKLSRYTKEANQIETKKAVITDPAFNQKALEAAAQQGSTDPVRDVARGLAGRDAAQTGQQQQFGYADINKAVIEQDAKRAANVEAAKVNSIMIADNYEDATQGERQIRRLPKEGDEGLGLKVQMNGNEAKKAGGYAIGVTKADGAKVDKLVTISDKLKYIHALRTATDNPDDLMSQISNKIDQVIAQKAGIDLTNGKITVTEAYRNIINSALADMQSANAPASSIATLQSLLTGGFAGPGAVEAVQQLRGSVTDNIRTILGASAVNNQLPSPVGATNQAAPSRPSVAGTPPTSSTTYAPLSIAPIAKVDVLPTMQLANIHKMRDGEQRRKTFDPILSTHAKEFGINPLIVYAVAAAESGYNPLAISKAGAIGIMQVMPNTAVEMGIPKDQHIGSGSVNKLAWAGVKYLSEQLKAHDNNIDLTLAAYNAGPGASGRRTSIPQNGETPEFVARVKENLAILTSAQARFDALPRTSGGTRRTHFE